MGFTLPETGLDGLDIEALAALEDEGLAAFRDLGIDEDSDADTIAQGEQIVAAIVQVREAKAALEAAEADRLERVAAIKDFGADAATEPEPVEAATDEPVDTAADEVAEATTDEPVEAAVEETPEEEAVSRTPAVTQAAQAAVDVVVPSRENIVTLTAAADVPGFVSGAELDDFASLGKAMLNRMKAFPTGRPTSQVFSRYGTAVITKQGFGELTQEHYRDDEDLLRAAVRQDRLPGGSLVAAGGWCSPSETMYDWCSDEEASNLLSLPEVNVTRGGMRFTKGPDFSDVFANVGFDLTEAEVIADTAKTVYEVTCPPFTDVRLDAVGVFIKAPILTQASYPEVVADVIRKSLVAHEMKINAKVLAAIQTALGAALTPANESTTVGSLEALQWVAESIRTKYGFSDSKTIEVIVPKWARLSIRQDLARRTGVDFVNVTDAQINAWFQVRNLAVQFVNGLDDLDVSSALQIVPKASFPALVYPAGSFVKGTSSVITLDSVYDSTDLAQNLYTALFAEEGVLVADRCYGGALVTIPVADSGRTGAANLVANFGTPEA